MMYQHSITNYRDYILEHNLLSENESAKAKESVIDKSRLVYGDPYFHPKAIGTVYAVYVFIGEPDGEMRTDTRIFNEIWDLLISGEDDEATKRALAHMDKAISDIVWVSSEAEAEETMMSLYNDGAWKQYVENHGTGSGQVGFVSVQNQFSILPE
jgi:hypothetical protein